MIKDDYKRQVSLLLSVLPEVAKESCFALHGGTAINLFIRNMPRLSVDIDLTYLPLGTNYEESKKNINEALLRIQKNILKILPGAQVKHTEENAKLVVSLKGAQIKIEVSLRGRGAIHSTRIMTLCNKAQEDFDAFVEMNVVSTGQLFGGKICAALDRQHPRDLFDVKYLLENEGFNTQVKEGFLYYLSGHSRPIKELLAPNWKDQSQAMVNAFTGMTEEEFSYDEYEKIRIKLLYVIRQSLTEDDKKFLLSIKGIKPEWSIYNFERFPNVEHKLRNLQKLKEENPKKYNELYNSLAITLNIS